MSSTEEMRSYAKIRAKNIVNLIYQPTGFLDHNKSSNYTWEWASNIAISLLEDLKQNNIQTLDDIDKIEFIIEEITKNK